MGDGWGNDQGDWDEPSGVADEPTPTSSSSVFADPDGFRAEPDDEWDQWDDAGVGGAAAAGGAGYGGGGGGGHERPADDYDDYDDYDDEPALGLRRGLVSATVVVLALLLGVGLAAVFERTGNDTDANALDTTERSSTSSTTTAVPLTIGSLPKQPDVAPQVTDGSSTSSSSTTVQSGAKTSTTASPPTTKRDEPPEPACASGGGGEPVPWQGEWQAQWTSKPQPNDPATISICIDDVTPKVGQKVTVTLKAKDPDAVITEQECGYLVAWDGNVPNLCRDAMTGSSGPRQTPREEPGDVLVRFTHTFTKAEPVSVAGSVISSKWEGYQSPYSSRAQAFLKVAVHD